MTPADDVPFSAIACALHRAFGTEPAFLPPSLKVLVRQLDIDDGSSVFARDLAALRPRLRSQARALTRDVNAAEDLVQDTLLKAWRSRALFTTGTNLRAWTGTILRNLFLSQCRRARFSGEYDGLDAEVRLARPAEQLTLLELAEAKRAIEQLVPEQRDALNAIAIEGLSYKDAARRIGVPLTTMKSRVRRARLSMQAILDGNRPMVPEPEASPARPPPRLPDQPPPRQAWAAAKASGQRLWIG